MMKVTAVNNGVVIDHITAGKCMKLYQFLDLDHVDATIALIKNAPSQKMGKKDIIKIDTELELDLDALGYIDPNVTINIVKDGVCVKKVHPQLPERLTNIAAFTANPRQKINLSRNQDFDLFKKGYRHSRYPFSHSSILSSILFCSFCSLFR